MHDVPSRANAFTLEEQQSTKLQQHNGTLTVKVHAAIYL